MSTWGIRRVLEAKATHERQYTCGQTSGGVVSIFNPPEVGTPQERMNSSDTPHTASRSWLALSFWPLVCGWLPDGRLPTVPTDVPNLCEQVADGRISLWQRQSRLQQIGRCSWPSQATRSSGTGIGGSYNDPCQ